MGIRGLAEMLGRMGYDESTMVVVLSEIFTESGDTGIMNSFNDLSRGLFIKPVRTGQYVFDYSRQEIGKNNYSNPNLSYKYKREGD